MSKVTILGLIINIIVAIAGIVVNIWIAKYNAGKNRKIYEIKPFFVGPGKGKLEDVNEALKSGDWTILHIGQDLKDIRSVDYVLGRLK
jgi:hypothetical protein